MAKDTSVSPTLTFVDAVAAIEGKGKSGGWYNGKCPAHTDSRASLGIKERPDGTFAIKCQAGCTREKVIAAFERETGKKFGAARKKEKRPRAERGITLNQYSDLKKLPQDFLTRFGTIDYSYDGKPAVMFMYLDGNMNFAGYKYRLSIDSHDTVWVDHKKSVPYGLVALQWWIDNDWPIDWVVICEGESDQQTLFFNAIPALGISGKNGWQPDFVDLPQLRQVKEVFIVEEPDAEDFVAEVAASFPDKKVFAIKLPVKDPSELWISNPSEEAFGQAWDKAMDEAIPLGDGRANTDTGNAERLVDKHGVNFRWLTDARTFNVWNGTVWHPDDTGDILLPLTKEVVRAIPNRKWQRESEAASRRKNMIAMSKGEIPVLAESSAFDRHPMLLNVQNCTLDLETDADKQFSREDFLTKRARVSYDPFAMCPKFDAFLDFTFAGNKDTIHFILKALGYTLTGAVGESCFFICYGLGANGKTTLIEVMMQLLGPDFARPAKFTTFVHSKFANEKYEIATFKGLRMVTAVEPRKAGHLDEEVLKQITGGDQIMARNIYERNVVYYPEFKLWLAMNNQPRIIGTDEGIWRRVRMIPFNVKVPDHMKVKDFHKVLFAEEGPGILNRLLEGLRAWREEGLSMSGEVAAATKEFRESQNVIEGFFATKCIIGKGYKAEGSALYKAYQDWAEEQNEYVIRNNDFAEELKRRSFERRRRSNGVIWHGITLRAAPERGALEADAPILAGTEEDAGAGV